MEREPRVEWKTPIVLPRAGKRAMWRSAGKRNSIENTQERARERDYRRPSNRDNHIG